MIRPTKIRAALRLISSWQVMKRQVAELTTAELGEAERIERQGKRRLNMLMVLKAERHKREGRIEKMHHLKMESNL